MMEASARVLIGFPLASPFNVGASSAPGRGIVSVTILDENNAEPWNKDQRRRRWAKSQLMILGDP